MFTSPVHHTNTNTPRTQTNRHSKTTREAMASLSTSTYRKAPENVLGNIHNSFAQIVKTLLLNLYLSKFSYNHKTMI